MASASEDTEIVRAAQVCAGRLQGLLLNLPSGIVGNRRVLADPGAWTAPPTHRMLAHPAYARVHAWMRRYRKGFQFDWEDPLFALPSRETWRLYEIWGLFRVLAVLLALGCRPVTQSGDGCLFAVKCDRLTFRLAHGTESRVAFISPRGEPLALSYNRSYPAGQQSLSRTMLPDIALEDGRGQTWVLDAKFKAYDLAGEESDDIDQMHAYRDAIVDSHGRRVVSRAWCLYAGRRDGPWRRLIAYGPPGASIVGALCLRPADAESFGDLCRLLAVWLR